MRRKLILIIFLTIVFSGILTFLQGNQAEIYSSSDISFNISGYLLNEGFEGAQFPPLGWDRTHTSWDRTTSRPWVISGTASAANSGSQDQNERRLRTPLLTLSGNTLTPFLYFNAMYGSIGYVEAITIQYSEDDIVWVDLETFPLSDVAQTFTQSLAGLNGNYYLGFLTTGASTGGRKVFVIDDVQIPILSEYLLTVDIAEGQGTVSINGIIPDEFPHSELVIENTQIILNAIPEDGWIFARWIVNGMEYYLDQEIDLIMNDEITATVYFILEPAQPVELTSFTAAFLAENYVQLRWVTETETNFLGYNVLRSMDNKLENASRVNLFIINGTGGSSQSQIYTFIDDFVEFNTTYYYWLEAIDLDLTTNYHGPVSVVTVLEDTEIPPEPEKITKLIGAYPNPFNPGTNIRFELCQPTSVTLTIYNLLGQRVREITQTFNEGKNSIYWDGHDATGKACLSGIYLYSISTESDFIDYNKMIMMK
ncbi:MAG: T9SS type A sorting domain-containing protein [Candidatus Cloacimonetes bacterium]|nr:T9SS type A sorting domain-containing protein [Candidatus Cloacimonadota bacterium]